MNLAQFQPHLRELRHRLLITFATIAVAFAGCFALSAHLLDLLFIPIQGAMPAGGTLVFTALPEGFMVHLKVSFWAALVITAPVALYQTWAFVAPGLYSHERKWVRRLVATSTALFTAGAAFGYFVAVPILLSYSMGFAGDGITPLPRLQNYMLFILKTMLALGITFELPFAMALLGRSGLVEPTLFRRWRKRAYLLLYGVAIFLSPGDIFTQLLLVLPLAAMYELGLIFSGARSRRTA